MRHCQNRRDNTSNEQTKQKIRDWDQIEWSDQVKCKETVSIDCAWMQKK